MKKPKQPLELLRRDTTALRKTVKEGTSCQVIACTEAFWVEITRIHNDTLYGKIDTDLLKTSVHGLKDGDEIELHYSNINKIRK